MVHRCQAATFEYMLSLKLELVWRKQLGMGCITVQAATFEYMLSLKLELVWRTQLGMGCITVQDAWRLPATDRLCS